MHDPRADEAEHHSWNVQGTARLLDACASYGVPKLIVLSSANVYGPRPDNPQFLTEDAPLLGGQHFPAHPRPHRGRHARAVVLLEAAGDRDGHPAAGAHPRRRAQRAVELPAPAPCRRCSASTRWCRSSTRTTWSTPSCCALDARRARDLQRRRAGRGAALDDPRELGRRQLPIPHPLARPLLTALWRCKLTSFPVPELDHIRYVCMVDGRRATETLGFHPRHTLKETIRAVEAR